MIFYYRWRKIQQLGLASEYKNEQSPIGTWLKHLFGLTFLPPAEVGDCFAEDFMCEKPENSKLDQFADYLVDNSTRILSTNQIYEIDQYGPITFVLKKLPRKFSLVKIATKNFQQNVSTRIFYFLFY
jgi:hypothetical protein